jgi:hypothetical protein
MGNFSCSPRVKRMEHKAENSTPSGTMKKYGGEKV